MTPDVHQKVQATHLQRKAYLYVRQSTLRQVVENTESTQRQYALRQHAVALGWPLEHIIVIDTDLGQSGAAATDREGFQRMVTEVSLGRAGLVLGLEVSRLARNSADWHRLLEICALTDTLILDEDGVYDPAHFNDRLLLGLNRPDSYSTSYWTVRSDVEFRCEVPIPSRRQMYPTCLEVKRRPKAVRHPAALSQSAICAYVCLFAS
jgi:Resolvase, N terminal domain